MTIEHVAFKVHIVYF